MRGSLAAVAIICALSFPLVAVAQDAKSEPKKPTVADALKISQSGDKARAAEMLHGIYESTGDSHALFLYAGLQEDMGNYDKAHSAYEIYVDKHGSGKHADDARARLEALSGKVKSAGSGSDWSVDPGDTKDPFADRPADTGGGGASAGVEPWEVPAAGNGGSQLSVRTDVKGALIMVDGVLVGTTFGRRTPVTQSISSGVHAVAVQRYGHTPWGAHVRADDGETLQLDLSLGREQSRGAKLASWSIGGLGAASVVAGVGIGVGALLDEDQSLAESADVMILGGLTAIAAGVVVHWVTRSKPTTVKLRSAR